MTRRRQCSFQEQGVGTLLVDNDSNRQSESDQETPFIKPEPAPEAVLHAQASFVPGKATM